MQNLGAEKIDLLAGQQVALLYKDEIQKQALIQSDALIIEMFGREASLSFAYVGACIADQSDRGSRRNGRKISG